MIKHRFYRHLIVIIILSSSSFHFAFSQELKERTKSVRLGDQTVYLKIFEKPGKDIVFAHVHENEVAALEAGKQILAKHGGRLVTLMHSSDGTKTEMSHSLMQRQRINLIQIVYILLMTRYYSKPSEL